jgi:hypothetical protein
MIAGLICLSGFCRRSKACRPWRVAPLGVTSICALQWHVAPDLRRALDQPVAATCAMPQGAC